MAAGGNNDVRAQASSAPTQSKTEPRARITLVAIPDTKRRDTSRTIGTRKGDFTRGTRLRRGYGAARRRGRAEINAAPTQSNRLRRTAATVRRKAKAGGDPDKRYRDTENVELRPYKKQNRAH